MSEPAKKPKGKKEPAKKPKGKKGPDGIAPEAPEVVAPVRQPVLDLDATEVPWERDIARRGRPLDG